VRQTQIHNAATGETVVRELTDQENIDIETSVAEETAAVLAKASARQSAIDKLAALGLTVDEIREAFGLEGS
jgi:ribosomal protein S11